MSVQDNSTKRAGIFLPHGAGRPYPMGRISAVFKADGDETQRAYSISECAPGPCVCGSRRTLPR